MNKKTTKGPHVTIREATACRAGTPEARMHAIHLNTRLIRASERLAEDARTLLAHMMEEDIFEQVIVKV